MNPPIEPTASIDDLPLEMISELFEYLQPKDLGACSLVNKRWHSIYASFKLHSLISIDYEDELCKWCDLNQTVEKKFCSWLMFRSLADHQLLSNLNRLVLSANECKISFNLNKLNNFQHLVHLETYSIPFFYGKVHLNLPRLKVLIIHHWKCPLTIECPELSTLVYYELSTLAYYERANGNLLKVKHPETIRKLETNMVGEKLVPFKGVECLVTKEYEAISKATILSLANLRELRYIQEISYFFFKVDRGIRLRDRVKLSEFLDEAKKLRGSDFRFTFGGLQLANVNVYQIDFGLHFDRFGGAYVCSEHAYMKNYHLIEPGTLHYLEHVDYTLLLSGVTGEFPRCFSQKFTGVRRIYASAQVPDADQFLLFLKSLRLLRNLYLEKTGLGQEFYDQLPASAHSLYELSLRKGYCEDGLQLNFEFISRLSCLMELSTSIGLSFESATSLVRSVGRLASCFFNFQSMERVWMVKDSKAAKWQIFKDHVKSSHLQFESEDPEEIVNFFKTLQKDQPELSAASD